MAQVLCPRCVGCHGDIETTTSGVAELVLTSQFVVCGDASVQDYRLCFEADDTGREATIDFSGADDGRES